MRKKVEYTQGEINAAGKHINNPSLSFEQRAEYLKIIDNWRAAHAFPMNTFATNLRHQISGIPDANVVQRLKRLDTILNKLLRFPTMKLYRMQDLGGCRVIVSRLQDVYLIRNNLKESRIRHKEHNFKDYIATPRDTGYRGIHIIYSYHSEKSTDYNGLLVEIQIRTQLQHLWATAVETIGVFTQNGLKFNQGSDRWLRFFKVVSALFAIEENTSIVEGAPTSIHAIITEIRDLMHELDVDHKLLTIGLATEVTKLTKKFRKRKTPAYYLLKLNTARPDLDIEKFTSIDKATDAYNQFEIIKNDQRIDAVLVSAQSFDALTHAYPNYFADITGFSNILHQLLDKYDP